MQHYHSLLHWQQHAMNESHFISRLQTEKIRSLRAHIYASKFVLNYADNNLLHKITLLKLVHRVLTF